MSYIPYRDNPDLACIDKALHARCEELAELIDQSSARSNHHDDCGCTDPACKNLERNLACHLADSTEAVEWLYAQGMLTLPGSPVPQPTREAERDLASMINRGRMASLGHCYDDIPRAIDFETASRIIKNGWRPTPEPSTDLGPDLVAEAGLTHVDDTTRTKVLAAFDAADPNAMTHRLRTHDITATEWLKHGDHPRVLQLEDPRHNGTNDNLMCCDAPAAGHGWIQATDEEVCPGDWITVDTDGVVNVFSAETFVSVYEPITADGAR